MSDDSTLKIPALDKLIKALNGETPVARIGILGTSNTRSGKGPTNATIGVDHEFGTDKLPIRSFLRIPLNDHLNEYLVKSGAFDKDAFAEVIALGSVVPWLKKVAAVAKTVVLDGFESGGFGKWKPSNMTNKKNKQTLVETTQLRDSITYEVVE